MKKNIKYFLLFLITIMMINPILNVYAYVDPNSEVDGDLPTLLYQEDFLEASEQEDETTLKGITYHNYDYYMEPGRYMLAEDIAVNEEDWVDYLEFTHGVSTLDLNGHSIDLSISVDADGSQDGANLTIDGGDTTVGTVFNRVFVVNGGNLTINGGNFLSTIQVSYQASLTINYANVNVVQKEGEMDELSTAIYASDDAVVTINDGVFSTDGMAALYLDSYFESGPESVVIQGGTFTGFYCGVDVESVKSLTINGGIFVGTEGMGLGVERCDSLTIHGGNFTGSMMGLGISENTATVSLSGGVYTTTVGVDRTIKSAIVRLSLDANAYQTIFQDMLADGYHYEPNFTPSNYSVDGIEKHEVAYMDQATISIVPDTNPDNIEYHLVSEDGKKEVIFTFQDGHQYQLQFEDILTLTPEQVEEKYGYPKEDYIAALEIIKNNVKKYGDLISLNAITINDLAGGNDYSSALKLKMKMTELMKKYKKLMLLYLDENNNFSVKEVVNLIVNGEWAEGNLNHLSVYALVGTNEEESSNEKIVNPATGDSLSFYLSIIVISALGLVGLSICSKKLKN